MSERIKDLITPRLLANRLNIEYKILIWLCKCNYKPEEFTSHYTSIRIPKGRKTRQVYKVSPVLKKVHQSLKEYLEEVVPATGQSYAYETGVGLEVAAARLASHPLLVTVDFVNHFHSVRLSQVKAMLMNHGFSDRVAYLIARLSCVTGSSGKSFLPQGSVVSPLLSNRVCEHLLDPLVKAHFPKAKYTRYSDNIYLGFDSNAVNGKEVVDKLEGIAASLRWKCHKKKILPYYRRQKALGFVCNGKPNIPKAKWLKLKAILHNLATCVEEERGEQETRAKEYFKISPECCLVRSLEGRANYWKPYLATTRVTLVNKYLSDIKRIYDKNIHTTDQA